MRDNNHSTTSFTHQPSTTFETVAQKTSELYSIAQSKETNESVFESIEDAPEDSDAPEVLSDGNEDSNFDDDDSVSDTFGQDQPICIVDPDNPKPGTCTHAFITGADSNRKIVSFFFGRNRSETYSIPMTAWPVLCRRHYQLRRWRNTQTYGIFQCSMIIWTLRRMEELNLWTHLELGFNSVEHHRRYGSPKPTSRAPSSTATATTLTAKRMFKSSRTTTRMLPPLEPLLSLPDGRPARLLTSPSDILYPYHTPYTFSEAIEILTATKRLLQQQLTLNPSLTPEFPPIEAIPILPAQLDALHKKHAETRVRDVNTEIRHSLTRVARLENAKRMAKYGGREGKGKSQAKYEKVKEELEEAYRERDALKGKGKRARQEAKRAVQRARETKHLLPRRPTGWGGRKGAMGGDRGTGRREDSSSPFEGDEGGE
ncbi:MAG: hypothetical protein Q9227_001359 [Pyrenula ochraceoflavens]